MRKKVWIILTVFVVFVLLIITFTTDLFQNLGLSIPRNFKQCVEFGGTKKITGEGFSAGQYCQWMGIKFKGPLVYEKYF